MVFRRRPPKRSELAGYSSILVPIGGTSADHAALQLAALLLRENPGGQVALLHVIEVPFDRQLDAEDDAALTDANRILEEADTFLRSHEIETRISTVQARAAGAAIVDDAAEQGADLIIMALPYKQRFGGQWDAGRTVPYVMRNSTAPVWCLRAETEELALTP
jgi:nucleotide-binding universal stress UspA family protein